MWVVEFRYNEFVVCNEQACPWDSQLREMRSESYMALGDPFKAASDIKALSKLIPDNTDAMYRLSMIYYQMGQAVDSLTYVLCP